MPYFFLCVCVCVFSEMAVVCLLILLELNFMFLFLPLLLCIGTSGQRVLLPSLVLLAFILKMLLMFVVFRISFLRIRLHL